MTQREKREPWAIRIQRHEAANSTLSCVEAKNEIKYFLTSVSCVWHELTRVVYIFPFLGRKLNGRDSVERSKKETEKEGEESEKRKTESI